MVQVNKNILYEIVGGTDIGFEGNSGVKGRETRVER